MLTFGEGLAATRSLGEDFLAFGNLSFVREAQAVVKRRRLTVLPRKRIPSSESSTEPCTVSAMPMSSDRCTNLPDEGLDATGTTVDLVEGDLADDLVAMLPFNCTSGWSCGTDGGGWKRTS